jgi:hypothetical protein
MHDKENVVLTSYGDSDESILSKTQKEVGKIQQKLKNDIVYGNQSLKDFDPKKFENDELKYWQDKIKNKEME